jgi:hypothetical protein
MLDMRFHFSGVARIELVIEERMKQNFVAGHVGLPSSATHAARSKERARANRDITVPTGTPTTSAISR